MQRDLLRLAEVNLLVFAPLLKPPKNILDSVGHNGNELCSLIWALSVNRPQNFPLPSVFLWGCGLKLIRPV